jgi:histidine ammonia-lyase
MGQEDAMTFAFEAAERLLRIESLVRDVVACQLLTAYQARVLSGRPVAAGLSHAFGVLSQTVQAVEPDRPPGGDIDRLVGLLAAGAFMADRQPVSA